MGRRVDLHVWTLSAFAFSQPVLDLLGRQPAFFLAHRTRLPDALILLALVCGALPTALILLRRVWVRSFPRTRKTADLLLIGVLAAAAALPLLKALRQLYGPYSYPFALALQWWPVFWLAALGAGAGAAALYARRPAARAFVTALSPALLLFPALFLWRIAPALPAAGKEALPVPAASDRSAPPPPIVFVVFDALALSALQDERSRIDPVRYPHFAALAETGFWFPGAKSASIWTEGSLPALLSGIAPAPGGRASAPSPRSLFTLLAGDYGFDVREATTRLCPESLCGSVTVRSGLRERTRLLLEDAAVASLHLLLPEEMTGGLPDVSGRWKSFVPREPRMPEGEAFRSFVRGIVPGERPTVHFMHVYLPHPPASYLPSGRRHRFDEPFLGSEDGVWTGPDALVLLAQQRYLLQVGFTDRLLGELLSRLREAALFDPALIVVTSDHGFNFWPGLSVREPVPPDPEDVRRVPLFVKLPRQVRGGAVPGEARGIDVLPTILAAAGLHAPADLPGRSLIPCGEPAEARALAAPGPALRRKLGLFGSGASRPDGLYRFGPDSDLFGRPVSVFGVGTAGVDLRWEEADAGFVPAYIRGTIAGRPAGTPPRLAVAVDGTIQAVGRGFPWKGRETGFAFMVPEAALRGGSVCVEVFELTGSGSGRGLRPPAGPVRLAAEPPVGRRLIY